jgi:tRNA A-37 threonylcarbamoyl transferase component Bud32
LGKVIQDIPKKRKEGKDYLDDLLGELSTYKTKTSQYFRDVSLYDLLNDAYNYKIKKASERRQVIFIKTSIGNFYIKWSFLVRRKDRLRHLFLPQRRWAEWKNLHKLNALGFDSAKPVLRGQQFDKDAKSYFIITEEVEGKSVNNYDNLDASTMGAFFANIHKQGIYYADLHPENLIIKPDGRPSLIDAQEIFFLKKLPKWLRSYNLGKLYLSLTPKVHKTWFAEFLRTYNERFRSDISIREIEKASVRHYNKHIKSRTKRCLKRSSEFEALKSKGQKIYRRRDFDWTKGDIEHAIKKGIKLKEDKVIAYRNVCIKVHEKGKFHKDRCLASWIRSRALDIRGIHVPKALGYFKFGNRSFFVCEYFPEGIGLNDYLPTMVGKPEKRKIIKELACWVRKIHDHDIWQKDFNSTNVLCVKNRFLLIDLDNVKCGKLSEKQKIYNLGQLNASVADVIRLKDRIRFFQYYFSGKIPSRGKRREIYRKIWEITLTKNTLVFGLDTSKSNYFKLPE